MKYIFTSVGIIIGIAASLIIAITTTGFQYKEDAFKVLSNIETTNYFGKENNNLSSIIQTSSVDAQNEFIKGRILVGLQYKTPRFIPLNIGGSGQVFHDIKRNGDNFSVFILDNLLGKVCQVTIRIEQKEIKEKGSTCFPFFPFEDLPLTSNFR